MLFMRADRPTLEHHIQTGTANNADSATCLRASMEECGYHVFTADAKKVAPYENGMIAVHPDNMSSVVLVHRRRKSDVFIIRPFVSSAAPVQLISMLLQKSSEISLGIVKVLVFPEGTDEWQTWIAEESRPEAREHGYL